MKNIACKAVLVLLGFALAAAVSFAQVKSYDMDIAGFNSIYVSDEFEVTLSAAAESKVTLIIDEPLKDYASINIKGSILNVSMNWKDVPKDIKKQFNSRNRPTYRIVIETSSDLSSITLCDKAVLNDTRNIGVMASFLLSLKDNAQVKGLAVDTQDCIVEMDNKTEASLDVKSDKLTVKMEGGSKLDVNKDVSTAVLDIDNSAEYTDHGRSDYLNVKASSLTKLALNGTAVNVCYKLKGSTKVNAINLIVKSADIEMEGLSRLEEVASESLKVDLKGGCTVIFGNNPTIDVVRIDKSTLNRVQNKKR